MSIPTPEQHFRPVATDEERALARKRVLAKRDLNTHVVVYVVVNAFFILIWYLSGQGYFWPAWVLGGWGIGLVLNVWEVYGRKPVTEADIDAELRRGC